MTTQILHCSWAMAKWCVVTSLESGAGTDTTFHHNDPAALSLWRVYRQIDGEITSDTVTKEYFHNRNI